MWQLGFFFHEIAFGLLSVFLPLYIVTFKDTAILGGPLVALGTMISLAMFLTIPASFLWGYLCDATRHYKIFILLSFLSSAIILFVMTLPLAQDIITFVILYTIMQILHVAHEAPKNVLVAENYTRQDWEKSYALYEGLTEIGFLFGLLVGLFTFTAAVNFSNIAFQTLYLCSILSLVAFLFSIFLVADPIVIFERRLVGIEKRIDFACRGVEASCKLMDGLRWDGRLKAESFSGFAFAIVLFALATGIFFTPLPIFLSQGLNLPTSAIYVLYALNSSGAMLGFFFIRNRARRMNVSKQMPRFILLRGILVLSAIAIIEYSFFASILAGLFLVFLGFSYAAYFILMLSLSMERIPNGKSGLFDVLVGLGTAIGSFVGPFLAEKISYSPTFLVAGSVFLIAFLFLKIQN
jgi:MFS family permease